MRTLSECLIPSARSARSVASHCARFAMVAFALFMTACVGGEQAAPTPSPTPSPISNVAADFFPVTVVVEVDKGWLTVGSVTRQEDPEDEAAAILLFEGSVKVLRSGTFDYRLSLTDSAGMNYEDSEGILLGEREEGDEPAYQTSMKVPADVTLTKVGFWVVGADRPSLSYLIELPVMGVPVQTQ